MGAARGVVERFLAAMTRHDWDAMASCLSDDVVRVGPFGDTYRGKQDYRRFISELMPTLAGYSMEVQRVLHAEGTNTVVVELSETVSVDGQPRITPESLVFDLDDAGVIAHISIYIQRLGD